MSDWNQAEHHAERARRFYQAGQWEKALAELNRAIASNPQQGDWHFGKGLTLDALRRFDEAVASFEEAWRLRGDDVETMLHLSVDLIRADKPKRAIEVLEKVAAVDPDCESSFCYRIAAYAQLGDHEAAETMFYLARQLSDECPVCLDHLAQSLATRGNYTKAQWCWQQVVKIEPRFPGVHLNLARLYWKTGRGERAEQEYQQHLREDPGDAPTRLEYGQLLLEEDRRAEAAEQFNRVLEFDATQTRALLHLGELALADGHYDAAQKLLERTAQQQPDLPGLKLRQAQLLFQRDKLSKARELALEEITTPGLNPSQALELGRLLIELQTPGPVPRLLESFISKAVEQGYPVELHATLLLCRGVSRLLDEQYHAGIRDCQRAHRLNPRHLLAPHNLVLAYLHERRWRRAFFWMRKALTLAPKDKDLKRLRWRLRYAFVRDRLRQILRRG